MKTYSERKTLPTFPCYETQIKCRCISPRKAKFRESQVVTKSTLFLNSNLNQHQDFTILNCK